MKSRARLTEYTIGDPPVPDTNVGHYGRIAAVGVVGKKRAYDLVAAWHLVITIALWSFGVRGTLF